MTPGERVRAVLGFQQPDDRLPLLEWAPWWDQTLRRWEREGLPTGLAWDTSAAYFGLDPMVCLAAPAIGPDTPPRRGHGGGRIRDADEYEAARARLYPEASIAKLVREAQALRARHARGEIVVRLWLDGFFWFPRAMLGIENHLYAFADQPDLLHRINADILAFSRRIVAALFPVLVPDFVGFAEDMSYNNGPMLSRAAFDAFLLPYYRALVPELKRWDTRVLVDSDGDVTTMVPWLIDAGIEGVYPLERQAGVDVARIRREHPRFLMLGGFDKLVMHRGEAALRAEFERLLPVMRTGGFLPSVDHQTPPGVSLAQYRDYVRLFRTYAATALA